MDAGDASSATTEAIDSMMRRLAHDANEEGIRLIRADDAAAALSAFAQAHELDGENAEIANNLAYAYHQLGNFEQAAFYYRLSLSLDPARQVAYLNFADLLLESRDLASLEEARALLQRVRELRGNDPQLILRQARVAAAQEDFAAGERFYREAVRYGRNDGPTSLEIGDFYRRFEREEEALSWYRRAGASEEAARERIRSMQIEREARRFGWVAAGHAIPEQARTLAERASAALYESRPTEAERLLRQALALTPAFSDARGLLGDALLAQGRVGEAELEYLRGLAFEQANADLQERLGRLYLDSDAPHAASAAALLLTRTLELRPDRHELRLALARALRQSGDLPGALRAVDGFLAARPDGDGVAQALLLKASVEQLLAQRAPSPAAPEGKGALGERGRLAQSLSRARALVARGESDAAMAELRAARETGIGGTDVALMEGMIVRAAGKPKEAVAILAAAAAVDAHSPELSEQLGLAELEVGDVVNATRELERAEALGSPTAAYHLARLSAEEVLAVPLWRGLTSLSTLSRAHERLARFVAQAPTSTFASDARQLSAAIERRVTAVIAGAALMCLALALLAFLAWRRALGGADLRTLVTQVPETGAEVRRLLSAIRHEVLKHNTLALSGVAEAAERGEEVTDKAAHLGRNLFGDGGAHSRLLGYLGQLTATGRAAGVRLNLARRDRAVAPILRGFALLARVIGRLSRSPALSPAERRKTTAALRRAAHLLNVEGYGAVQSLLDQLRTLTVDAPLIHAVFSHVAAEPAFSGAAVLPLSLSDAGALPSTVAVPRADFEDMIANLLRNALESSQSLPGPLTVGVACGLEVDPITGRERLIIAVLDRSPEALTPEMLRGRAIERGLGITSERVSRYDGSLDVESAAAKTYEGWRKAVVLKLPRADSAEVPQ